MGKQETQQSGGGVIEQEWKKEKLVRVVAEKGLDVEEGEEVIEKMLEACPELFEARMGGNFDWDSFI